MANTALYP